MAHDYEIIKNGQLIVSISKEWMTWGDSYCVDIPDPSLELQALAVVLAIDCANEAGDGVSVGLDIADIFD